MEYYHFQLKKTRAAFIKLGHRFSQILTDIWLFVAFNILVIRFHPCPQKKKFLYFRAIIYIKPQVVKNMTQKPNPDKPEPKKINHESTK